MDFVQTKLSKSEWETLEIPLPEEEQTILSMIYNAYNNTNYSYNSHQSMMSVMKLQDDDKHTIMNSLFHTYFYPTLKSYTEKYHIHYSFQSTKKETKLKKVDAMKIELMNKKLKENQTNQSMYEYVLMDVLEQCLKCYSSMDTKMNYYYYTLTHLIKMNILSINVFLLEYIHFILDYLKPHISTQSILYNANEWIEKNEYLHKYSDITLYDHQKELFSITKQPQPKLILYQAPTGTGKTISPIGLASSYKIIFVCAAKHIGLQLAKSCISMEIPIAVAFGCNDPGDIRLHYFAAKDYVKHRKSGGIFKVDNSVGDKVQVIISDIQSYIPSMLYMLAFNKQDEIITYWDEPTITLDYENHEFHTILQKNWRENTIPTVILSSATLPKEHELQSMTEYFTKRFENASIYTIDSHSTKKTIPILNSEGYVCLPHLLYSTKRDMRECLEHCNEYKTLFRHFELTEIVRFIQFLHSYGFVESHRFDIHQYFPNVEMITTQTIKQYYLDVMNSIVDSWDDIYNAMNEYEYLEQEEYIPQRSETPTGSGRALSYNADECYHTTLPPSPAISINSVSSTYSTTTQKMVQSSVYITTQDAHTLTDGPTIYLTEQPELIAKTLLQMTDIPKERIDIIKRNIEFNNELREKLDDLEKEYRTQYDKLLTSKSTTNDNAVERSIRNDTKLRELTQKMEYISNTMKQVNLDESYVPNKPSHLKKYGVGQMKNAYTSDIDESVVEEIMKTNVDDIWKIMLLLGIGVFQDGIEDVRYLEIMKKLAQTQKLYMIMASSDYIYGTNYQFSHGYIGKDLCDGISQEKVIQAFGRVGRGNTNHEYSIRLRENSVLEKVFKREKDKKEVTNMNKLFGSIPNEVIEFAYRYGVQVGKNNALMNTSVEHHSNENEEQKNEGEKETNFLDVCNQQECDDWEMLLE